MPRVIIEFNRNFGEYSVFEATDTWPTRESEYSVVVDMKSNHYRNLKRNEERYIKDQNFLEKFFVEAQMSGRQIREQ